MILWQHESQDSQGRVKQTAVSHGNPPHDISRNAPSAPVIDLSSSPGVGLALWRAIDGRYKDLRQDIVSIRQEMAEIRQDVRSLHSRIDSLYQALFSRKDPAS